MAAFPYISAYHELCLPAYTDNLGKKRSLLIIKGSPHIGTINIHTQISQVTPIRAPFFLDLSLLGHLIEIII